MRKDPIWWISWGCLMLYSEIYFTEIPLVSFLSNVAILHSKLIDKMFCITISTVQIQLASDNVSNRCFYMARLCTAHASSFAKPFWCQLFCYIIEHRTSSLNWNWFALYWRQSQTALLWETSTSIDPGHHWQDAQGLFAAASKCVMTLRPGLCILCTRVEPSLICGLASHFITARAMTKGDK